MSLFAGHAGHPQIGVSENPVILPTGTRVGDRRPHNASSPSPAHSQPSNSCQDQPAHRVAIPRASASGPMFCCSSRRYKRQCSHVPFVTSTSLFRTITLFRIIYRLLVSAVSEWSAGLICWITVVCRVLRKTNQDTDGNLGEKCRNWPPGSLWSSCAWRRMDGHGHIMARCTLVQ